MSSPSIFFSLIPHFLNFVCPVPFLSFHLSLFMVQQLKIKSLFSNCWSGWSTSKSSQLYSRTAWLRLCCSWDLSCLPVGLSADICSWLRSLCTQYFRYYSSYHCLIMKHLNCKESKQPKIKVNCSDTIVIHLVQLRCQVIGFVGQLYCFLVKFYHASNNAFV